MKKEIVLKYLIKHGYCVIGSLNDFNIKSCNDCPLKGNCIIEMTNQEQVRKWANSELAKLPPEKTALEQAEEYFNTIIQAFPDNERIRKSSFQTYHDKINSAVSDLQKQIAKKDKEIGELCRKSLDPYRVEGRWVHNCDECGKDKEIEKLKAEKQAIIDKLKEVINQDYILRQSLMKFDKVEHLDFCISEIKSIIEGGK